MGFKPRVRKCACGCRKEFKMLRAWHIYATKNCRNNAAQERYRARYAEMAKSLGK